MNALAARATRRRFLGFLTSSAASLGVLAVAGCGQAAPAASPAAPTAASAAKSGGSAAPTAAPAAAAAPSSSQTTINVLTWAPANDVGRQNDQKYLDSYVSANHLNVTVKTQDVPFGSYMQKLQTMFAGNVAPDVLWNSIWRTGPFVSANKVMSLEDYAAKDKSLPKYRPAAYDDGKFGGKLYGLPTAASTWVLFYNADLFKAAGLTAPPDLMTNNQWNWDQTVSAAKKLTQSTSGRVTQFGYMTDPQFYTWCSFAYANGGEFLSKDHTKFLVSSSETTEALQWLGDMIVSLKVSPTITDQQQEGYVPRFVSGKLAMMTDWAGTGIDIHNAVQGKFTWDIVPVPWTKNEVGYWHPNLIEVNSATASKDNAWEICKQLASLEIEKTRLQAGIANTPLVDDESLISLYNKTMPMKNAKVVIDLLDKSIPLPYNDNWEEQRFKVIEPFMQQVYSGQVKAADQMATIQQKLDDLLPKS